MHDVRHALRSLRRTPGLSLLAWLTLAVGIGGSTAVFTVVNSVLIEALPYPGADRIVMISEANDRTRTMGVSNPNFEDWHAAQRSFSAMAAWTGGRSTVVGGTEPVVTGVFVVTREFFAVVGVGPAVGRGFTADETRPNGPPAAIVSHGLWQRVLGGRDDLSGLTLRVAGETAAVVGVMPPGFEYPAGASVWVPKERTPDPSGRTAHNLRVVARLADGVPLEQARAEMSAIAARLEAEHGDDHDGTDASVDLLQTRIVGPVRPMLLVLLGAVALVLLGACVNVAGMLVARGVDRRRDLAVRLALGAARGRLVRLLFVEHVVLALAAGVAGLALANGLVRALVALAPAQLPRLGEIVIDGRVAMFAAAVTLLTPLVFGLVPALQLSGIDLREALTDAGRGAAGSRRSRTRHALVAVQVALALVLLCGSGLLVRSFVRLLSVDPGFEPAGAIAMQTTVPGDRYPDGPRAALFYQALLDRVAAVPGVRHAGIVNTPPLSGLDASGAFLHEGQAWEEIRGDWTAQSASYRVSGGDYFRAMGIPIVRGRGFDTRDVAGNEPVAVINQTLATRHFAGRDPIGARIRFAGMDRDNPWLTIVGVARDVRHRLADDAVPEVYVHYQQLPMRMAYFVTTLVRLEAGASVEQVAPRLRAAVRALDADVPAELAAMTSFVERSVADRRFAVLLITAFGAMALLLAAVGIYGALAQTVAARTQEIGVRMALGARAASVVAFVLRGALVAVASGAAAGLVAAVLLARVLDSLLYEIEPTDFTTYVGVIAALGAVAVVAAIVPAHRATRVDPVVAMRT